MGLLVSLIVFACISKMIYGLQKTPGPDPTLPRILSLSSVTSIRDDSRYLSLYGPNPQSDPKCDFDTLMRNENEADRACSAECRDIAMVVDDAAERYSDYYPVRKLYDQCHGFLDGDCRRIGRTQLTWCQCHGADFYRPARVCRLLIGAARITSNVGISWRDYRAWHEDYKKRMETEARILSKAPSKRPDSPFLQKIKSVKSFKIDGGSFKKEGSFLKRAGSSFRKEGGAKKKGGKDGAEASAQIEKH